jgi:hypothetical protein
MDIVLTHSTGASLRSLCIPSNEKIQQRPPPPIFSGWMFNRLRNTPNLGRVWVFQDCSHSQSGASRDVVPTSSLTEWDLPLQISTRSQYGVGGETRSSPIQLNDCEINVNNIQNWFQWNPLNTWHEWLDKHDTNNNNAS